MRKKCSYSSFSGLYFPVLGINTEIYGVNLSIQSKCGEIRTRKTPNTDPFHAADIITVTSVSGPLVSIFVPLF